MKCENYIRKRMKVIEKHWKESVVKQKERLLKEKEQEKADIQAIARLRDINDPLPSED